MFFRLLMESFRRQRRRKLLAGLAILLGTTAVTAMLALATTIGDRIHQELAVYGANIVVHPAADQLEVKVGGVDVKPVSGGAYLHESDLAKLKTIFWANNITGVSPELTGQVTMKIGDGPAIPVTVTGFRLEDAQRLHPWWKFIKRIKPQLVGDPVRILVGAKLAARYDLKPAITPIELRPKDAPAVTPVLVGILSTGDDNDNKILMDLKDAQNLFNAPDAVSRVEVSARTKPEDAFARKDPDSLSPKLREIWYCRPYANAIAYQIREAIPGSRAEQVRRVEQSEGNVLKRISGLMWLISAAALLAAGFAVSAAMATAILERQAEIGLMRSLGASKTTVALLFYAETGLLAILAGSLGYLAGSGLAAWLGARIFATASASTGSLLIPVLFPVVIALALAVALAGSTPAIRRALTTDPSTILRAGA